MLIIRDCQKCQNCQRIQIEKAKPTESQPRAPPPRYAKSARSGDPGRLGHTSVEDASIVDPPAPELVSAKSQQPGASSFSRFAFICVHQWQALLFKFGFFG